MHAGTTLADRYVLLEPVPDRGLGETWRARDQRREGATVQIKFLRAAGGDDVPPDALKVIRALRALRHPAIPSIVNHGVHAGRPWIASDDLLGDSVGTLLDKARGRDEILDLALIRLAFDGVAAALSAAHTAPLPVLHGALTPGSVLVLAKPARGPACALLDLGLAPWLDPPTDAPARSARMLIAPAPEVARGGAPTVATDVFTLGALLTELLALPAPVGQTMLAVNASRRRADVPPGVWKALERAMAIAPEQRFASVDALAAALAAAWADAPAPRRSQPPVDAPRPPSSERSSLLETQLPSTPPAPRPSVPAPAPVPAVAAPILGSMPALAPPESARPRYAPTIVDPPARLDPPAKPADWQNPWATALIQGKAPPAAVDGGMMDTTLPDPVTPRHASAVVDLDSTADVAAPNAAPNAFKESSRGPTPLQTIVAAAPSRPPAQPEHATIVSPARGLARAVGPSVAPSVQPAAPSAMLAAPQVQPVTAPLASPTASTLPIPPASGASSNTPLLAVGFVLAVAAVAAVAYWIASR